MPIKGTYYNATLGSAPTLNTQLGGLTLASFVSGPLASGFWANSNSASLPAGTYFVVINPNFVPGASSTVTFTRIVFTISQQINGQGGVYFNFNDTTVKATEVNGTGSSYATIYQTSIIKLIVPETIFACVLFDYTKGGAENNAEINLVPGAVAYYRIA
jgi:hypothetical protein